MIFVYGNDIITLSQQPIGCIIITCTLNVAKFKPQNMIEGSHIFIILLPGKRTSLKLLLYLFFISIYEVNFCGFTRLRLINVLFSFFSNKHNCFLICNFSKLWEEKNYFQLFCFLFWKYTTTQKNVNKSCN